MKGHKQEIICNTVTSLLQPSTTGLIGTGLLRFRYSSN